MVALYAVGGVVTIALFVYLFTTARLKPEWF